MFHLKNEAKKVFKFALIKYMSHFYIDIKQLKICKILLSKVITFVCKQKKIMKNMITSLCNHKNYEK